VSSKSKSSSPTSGVNNGRQRPPHSSTSQRNLSEEWRRRRWQGRFSVARAFRRPSSPMRVRPCRHYTALASSLLFTLLLSCQNILGVYETMRVCVCLKTLKIRCLADKRPSWVPSCLSSSSSSRPSSCVVLPCQQRPSFPRLQFFPCTLD